MILVVTAPPFLVPGSGGHHHELQPGDHGGDHQPAAQEDVEEEEVRVGDLVLGAGGGGVVARTHPDQAALVRRGLELAKGLGHDAKVVTLTYGAVLIKTGVLESRTDASSLLPNYELRLTRMSTRWLPLGKYRVCIAVVHLGT